MSGGWETEFIWSVLKRVLVANFIQSHNTTVAT